jgi:FixJ family two-component response regulator
MPSSLVHVVDDDELARKATARLIGAAGFDVRTYVGAEDFLTAITPDMPGCIILDLRLPGKNGLEIQLALADRGMSLPIIFMSGHGQIPETVSAMRRGALDFLTKPVDGAVLLAAVSRAIAQDAAARKGHAERGDLRSRYDRLTSREREVFLHLIKGQLNKDIAAELHIAEHTVKMHRANIFQKLEVHSMVEVARLAVELEIEPAKLPS